MKLLHVVPTYLPATRYGGPIRSVHGLCRSLAARGHDIHVLTTNVDGKSTSDVEIGQPVTLDSVTVTYHKSPFPRLYWSPGMGRFLRANVNSYDLLHLHSVFLWPTTAAASTARANGIPYVLSPRGMLEKHLIDKRSTLPKKAWIQLFEKKNLKDAAAVHVTSEREKCELEALDLGSFHFALVPNGISRSYLELAPVMGRKPSRILYLGRLNWTKGVDRLLSALAWIDQAELLIVGPDEDGWRKRLEKQAHALGVAQRVTFMEPVSGREKWRLLDEATVLVLPSRSENFGIVVIEALARGLPVVVSRDVGVADVVAEHEAGLITDAEPQMLAEAIKKLLDSAELRIAMGQRGHRLVCDHFTWDSVANDMERVYETIVGQRLAASC